MSSKSSIILSGVIAAIIAVALIGTALFTGLTPLRINSGGTSTTTSTGAAGGGTLAVLLTDPPTVPIGTTALYASYSDVQVHINGEGNDSGWIDLHSSGSINLMGVVNATQTIASAKIQQGDFNALRFNITSAVITYQGKNYSVGLIYQEHMVFVPISGGIAVQNGQTAVSVIDLTPTVILVGDPQNPSFVLIPLARGYVLPASSVSQVHTEVGERDDIEHNPALMWLHQNSHFQITAVKLTPNSLSITVTNTGSVSLVFRVAAVTSTQSVSGGLVQGDDGIPSPSISEFFAVAPNSSLIALTGANHVPIFETIAANGYLLPPAASVTFGYAGPITLGVLTAVWHPGFQTHSIIPGQQYTVRIMASGLIASTEVSATAS